MSTFHRVLSTFRNIALILTVSGLVHAQVPISGLPQATLPLTGNESVVMNQNGTTKQGKVSSITSLVSLSAATGITLTPNPIVGGAGTIGLTLPVLASWGGTGELGTITGIPKANGTSAFTTASSSDVPIPGSNTQILYNSSGVLGASSLMTFTPGSVVLNLGAATTPGTFSVGQLDTMVINGVTVPIPGFAINSNIQGVIENHSYSAGPGTGGARYYGVRSRGTISSPTIVSTGDHLSNFYAAGYNGTSYSLGGYIRFQVDGTPGASAMPSDLDFAVSPAGSQTPTSRLTLMNDGSYAVSGSVGTSGQVLTSAGSGSPASWATPAVTGLANPTGTIGLTAVNGVATTAPRSDSAPALSQAISPTWTGVHTFSTTTTSQPVILTSSAAGGALFEQFNSSNAANTKCWMQRIGSTGAWALDPCTDAGVDNNTTFAMAFTRTGTGTGIGAELFGNSTDQPTYQYNGVPTFTVNGTTNGWSWGGSTAGSAFPVLARYNAGSGGTDTIFYHSRGATIGTNTILQSGDELGSISFDGSDGTATPVRGARIIGFVDGAPTAGVSYPGRLEFYTVPSGSTSILQRMVLNNAGSLSINAPSAGNALSVTGLSGNYAEVLTAGSTASQSFGLQVVAGTNSSDRALQVSNQANSASFLTVFGDGSIATGATATGQGAGTLNVSTQYYRAGLPMFPVIGVGSCNAGGCTALRATGMSTTITRAGPGQYTVTFTNSFAGQNVCFVTVQGTTAAYGVANPVAGSTTVNTFNSAGTLTDTIWGLTCT